MEDGLSRIIATFNVMNTKVICFDKLKDEYAYYLNFFTSFMRKLIRVTAMS